MNQPFKKVVRPGKSSHGVYPPRLLDVTVQIEYKVEHDKGRLSIVGNHESSGGQIVDLISPKLITKLAPGWTPELVQKLHDTWERWHLNDTRPGSPAQAAWLRENPPGQKDFDHYRWATAALEKAGLNPDPSYLHNGKPYSYGHAWLFEEVPDEVLDFLRGLPDADKTPAWV